MPNALLAARPVSGAAFRVPTGAPGPEILPSAVLAARGGGREVAAPAPARDTIRHVAPAANPTPPGRRTKEDRAREARAEATSRILALAETNPSRGAVRSYFLGRIVDLRTA
jgi:hypothetical protein